MRKRYRFFFKMLIPYLALLYAVLLAISGAVYQSFLNTLTGEVEQSQIAMTDNARKYWDSQMEAFTRIALSIVSDDRFEPHQLYDGGYNDLLAQEELVRMKAGSDILTDIVYYPLLKNDSDMIYSTMSTCDFSLFFGSICVVLGKSPDDMRALMEQISGPTILPMQTIVSGITRDPYLLYLYPYKVGDKTSAVVLFVIRNSSLETQLGNILGGNSGYVYISDQTGKIVSSVTGGESSASFTEMVRRVDQTKRSSGTSRIRIDGEDYILTRRVSSSNGWSYNVVTDSRQFMKKVYSSRAVYSAVLFLLAVFGSVGAFLIALRNYLPLHSLANSVRDSQAGPGGEEPADEISFVSRYIGHISHKNLHYETRQSLWDILLGKSIDRAAVQKRLTESGVLRDRRNYRVLLFFRDSAESGLQVFQGYPGFFEMMAAQSGIPVAFGFDCSDNRSCAVLLCYPGEPNSPCVSQFLESVNKTLENGVTFTIGIGAPVGDIFCSAESMRQASAAVYYRVIRGKNSVIAYSDIETTRRHYIYPFEYEQKLTSAIKQARTREIEPVMQAIIAYVKEKADNPDAARCICMGVAYAVVQTLEEIRVGMDAFDNDENYLYPMPYEPVEQFASRVCNLCERVCDFINRHKESRNNERAQNARQYILDHFTDNSLSLNAIADDCGVSVSYLSRFFKEQFGENVAQYIENLRLTRAKELLADTNQSLKEITLATGYGSETNFIRKFKKEEGITPIKFRELSCAVRLPR